MYWAALLFALLQAAQTPQAPATATIRGRITDAVSGDGIAGARVTVNLPAAQRMEGTAGPDGRYEIAGIPAGTVSISANAGEFRATHLGAEYSTETPAGNPTSQVTLQQGEMREGLDVSLPRAFAVSGRVVDDRGQPLAGLMVDLLEVTGRRRGFVRGSTDDRGAFRIHGVPPGRYFVCAHSITSGGGFGNVSGDRRRLPVPACHPSATAGDLGRPITVSAADVEGIEIQAPRVATLRITGRVVNAAGEPASDASFSISSPRPDGAGGWRFHVKPDGTFTVVDVLPGRHILEASTAGYGQDAPADFEYADMDVMLQDADLEDVTLVMRRSVSVRGRLTFDGAPPASLGPIAVAAEIVLPHRSAGGRYRQVPVGADQAFELKGLVGPRILRMAGGPRGWIVKSVRYRGQDITDLATEFTGGKEEIEIELTTSSAVLTGGVIDGLGNPAARSRVLIFPADAARRVAWARGVAVVNRDGRFTLPPRRAGEYLVVALSADDYAALGDDASALARVEPLAERVTLLEGDRRAIDLRILAIPADPRR